ncbi:TRAP transporter substrate-binding protein DctP, partial [Thermodesulfobacteriota bacterium]
HLMGWPYGAERLTKIWAELHEKVPAMKDTFKDVKLLWLSANPLMELHFTKKTVRVPGDMKGLKVTSAAPEVLVSLGASAVSLPPPEVYTGLERGVAEGLNGPYSFLFAFKILPLVPYHTKVDCGSNAFAFIMNLNKWNSLPSDVQKVIDGLSPWGAKRFCETAETLEAMGIKKAKELGHTFTVPNAKEMKLWFEGAKPGHEKWIKRMESKGLPGNLVYKTAKQLIEQYRK